MCGTVAFLFYFLAEIHSDGAGSFLHGDHLGCPIFNSFRKLFLLCIFLAFSDKLYECFVIYGLGNSFKADSDHFRNLTFTQTFSLRNLIKTVKVVPKKKCFE